jgi:two-component system sensor histidine kinase DegS
VTVTKKGEARALSSEQELGVFRIVQEALSNVEKHAHASRVDVRVECTDDCFRVTVSDDGRGFETPPDPAAFARAGRYGLLGMQERAALHSGTLSVRSSPGGGTTVALEISAAMPAAAVN